MSFWDQFMQTPSQPGPPPKSAIHTDVCLTTAQFERIDDSREFLVARLAQEPRWVVRLAMPLAEIRRVFGDPTIQEVLDVPSQEL